MFRKLLLWNLTRKKIIDLWCMATTISSNKNNNKKDWKKVKLFKRCCYFIDCGKFFNKFFPGNILIFAYFIENEYWSSGGGFKGNENILGKFQGKSLFPLRARITMIRTKQILMRRLLSIKLLFSLINRSTKISFTSFWWVFNDFVVRFGRIWKDGREKLSLSFTIENFMQLTMSYILQKHRHFSFGKYGRKIPKKNDFSVEGSFEGFVFILLVVCLQCVIQQFLNDSKRIKEQNRIPKCVNLKHDRFVGTWCFKIDVYETKRVIQTLVET